MRIVFVLAALTLPVLTLPGCISSSAVSAFSTLSSLPDDRAKREERLNSEMQRPDPEEQAKKSPRALKIETAAATTAAFLGILFSNHSNVTVGVGVPLNENRMADPGSTETEPESTTDEASEHTAAACFLLFRNRPEACTER